MGGPWCGTPPTCSTPFVTPIVKQLPRKRVHGAAAHAETVKAKKYAHLDRAYQFQPIAMATCGAVGPDSTCFLRNLGRRLKSATGEPNSLTYLLQRITTTEQGYNNGTILQRSKRYCAVGVSTEMSGAFHALQVLSLHISVHFVSA